MNGRRKSISFVPGGFAGSFSSFERAGASKCILERMTTALCCRSDPPPSPSPSPPVMPASSPAARWITPAICRASVVNQPVRSASGPAMESRSPSLFSGGVPRLAPSSSASAL